MIDEFAQRLYVVRQLLGGQYLSFCRAPTRITDATGSAADDHNDLGAAICETRAKTKRDEQVKKNVR